MTLNANVPPMGDKENREPIVNSGLFRLKTELITMLHRLETGVILLNNGILTDKEFKDYLTDDKLPPSIWK